METSNRTYVVRSSLCCRTGLPISLSPECVAIPIGELEADSSSLVDATGRFVAATPDHYELASQSPADMFFPW